MNHNDDTLVEDFVANTDEYESLLDEASMQASTDFEERLVADLRNKFEIYGMQAFLSRRQFQLLQKIAGEDES